MQSAANKEANLVGDQGADQGEDVEGNHGHLEQNLMAQRVPEAATDHEEATILCRCTSVSGWPCQGRSCRLAYCQGVGRHDPLE